MGACFLFDFLLKGETLNKAGKKNSQKLSVRKCISVRVEKLEEKNVLLSEIWLLKGRKRENLHQHVHSALECTFETNLLFVPTYHTPVHIMERSPSERTGFVSD